MKSILAILAFSSATAVAAGTVTFKSPTDKATVPTKFKVVMDVAGMKVRPAGEDPNDKKTGHHHLLVDQEAMAEGQVIPTDDKHLHFGKGQTETEVTLPPGSHTLTLQFADGAHRSYGPAMSKTIHVTVK